MDKYVKQSIDARKNAIFAAYNVDDAMNKKIEALFSEIEKLGKEAKDAGDFEAKFAASPLNQKYLDLFTEVATNSQPANAPEVAKPKIGKTIAGGVAAGVAESALDDATCRVVPTRAAVHQKATDALRDVPVVGDAMDISQKAGYAMHLGKLFRKKDKKKED
ncbi:hypothetical protein IKD57_00655 [Candidatus Saccharibacteria bacterium]|nr:hypothetical protein [Candidatus Saccharibacteria bacterium]